ncbi:Uncharacterised protein [BD1-7 clade bacterium]|uniref:Glycosyltransferase RgtA/B/C/D-like domain-containing protein n=1 Tax=BD1-7 clade bacterium TaxID=2029982 RepID=A0A5S9MW83_9GAMM|nr:Uncharacterised protein [BD1-7 clade bacterium]CAA0083202.1 Uncharacterised protein [BD1-7 clade bacterium]
MCAKKSSITYFVYVMISLSLALFAATYPKLNWDMIAYVTSAHIYLGYDPLIAHSMTYQALQAYVAPDTFNILTSGDYRTDMMNNPELFYHQLPFYTIRVLYIACIAIGKTLSLNPFVVSHAISAIATLTSLVLLANIFLNTAKASSILLWALPIVLIPFGLIEVAQYSTPDGLALLATIFICKLLIEKKYRHLFIFLPIAILVRTDLIMLTILLAIYFIIWDKHVIKGYALSAFASLLVYFSVNKLSGNYGWHTIFYFTLVERLNNPSEVSPIVDINIYLHALKRGISRALNDLPLLIYTIVNLFYLKRFLTNIRTITDSAFQRLHTINLILFGYSAAHFVLFPVIWPRFYLAQYAITLLLVIVGIQQTKNIMAVKDPPRKMT